MPPKAFVTIRNLRKTYQMGTTTVHALDGVDLDIPRNSLTVVMGPSGSGKSTLLYLLGGLDRATSGILRSTGRRWNRWMRMPWRSTAARRWDLSFNPST